MEGQGPRTVFLANGRRFMCSQLLTDLVGHSWSRHVLPEASQMPQQAMPTVTELEPKC